MLHAPTAVKFEEARVELERYANKEVLEYYCKKWDNTRERWVCHLYDQEFKCRNNTTNRVEAHNGTIKTVLSSSAKLSEALSKLVNLAAATKQKTLRTATLLKTCQFYSYNSACLCQNGRISHMPKWQNLTQLKTYNSSSKASLKKGRPQLKPNSNLSGKLSCICNGDSHTYFAICEYRTYNFTPSTKEDCVNHVKYSMVPGLRGLITKGGKGQPLGGRAGQTQIKKLANCYGMAL